MAKKKTLRKLVDDLAVLLQKLVRVKAAVHEGKNGLIKCVSCGTWGHYKEMQGGHWIERGKQSTKIIEEIINPQCPGCNGFGMKYSTLCRETYRKHMHEMHGEEQCDSWLRLSNQPAKHFRPDIEDRISETKKLIKELEDAL